MDNIPSKYIFLKKLYYFLKTLFNYPISILCFEIVRKNKLNKSLLNMFDMCLSRNSNNQNILHKI